MRRQPQARGTKARSRIDAFHQLEGQLGQISTPKGPQIEAQQVYIGKKIFEARQLSKSYGNKEVIKNFTYTFARHDRGRHSRPQRSWQKHPRKAHSRPNTTHQWHHRDRRNSSFRLLCTATPSVFRQQKKVIEVVTDIADEIEHLYHSQCPTNTHTLSIPP